MQGQYEKHTVKNYADFVRKLGTHTVTLFHKVLIPHMFLNLGYVMCPQLI